MESSPPKVIGYVLAGILGLIVGYFAGREHLKYEMASALQTAVGQVRQGLPAADKPIVPHAPVAAPTPTHQPEPPVLEVVLISKGFKPSDPSIRDYEDDITLGVSFKNLSDKDIRAFDGSIIFTDLLDNKILVSGVAINEVVKAGAALKWAGAIKYNQFIDDQQRLRNEAQENLKIVFVTKKVLFADGTVKTFE
jgi:hypothetical protein